MFSQQAGGGGEDAPQNQAPEDQFLGAALLGVVGGRHLEEEVAEEEQRAEQGRGGGVDVQVVRHAARRAEAVVGAIDVSEAVGDERDRNEPGPTAGVSVGVACWHGHPPVTKTRRSLSWGRWPRAMQPTAAAIMRGWSRRTLLLDGTLHRCFS